MTATLTIRQGGPHLSIQDLGRPGYLALGLARGGAADRLALYEGAALLGQTPETAAIEMAGHGGTFEASEDIRIALTGAPMRARIGTTQIAWNASHLLPKGERLTIGAAEVGVYGYLHIGGGIATDPYLDARATHLAAGIGAPLDTGAHLPLGPDPQPSRTGYRLTPEPRFTGGTVRILPGLHHDLFTEDERTRFAGSVFTRDARSNRMGVTIVSEGDGFASDHGLSVLSEIITPGDIQITGDGTPVVLLSECQTTGGYPRIGTVLPSDLPIVAQAPLGASLRFTWLTRVEALKAEQKARADQTRRAQTIEPLIRRVEDMADLLSYQLISGVTAGDDLDRPEAD